MKQLLLGIAIVMLYLMTPGTYASAQSNEDVIAYVANSHVQHYELADDKNFTEPYVNDINIKAKRNFAKSFQDITDEKWYRIKGGYFASFKRSNIKTEVYYNNRGTWLYNLLIYQEGELPSLVRNLVKSEYRDYSILTTFECQFFDRPVYIIKMKNTNTCKTVMVCDNEMQVIEEFTNASF
jgi:hypothetical protein